MFRVEGAEAHAYAAAPLLVFKVRITNANPKETLHSVSVQCQIQIQSARRRYTAEEQQRLTDLFGSPDRWSLTLRNMLWTHSTFVVPGFQGVTFVDLPVHCTFDFNVAATKYFAAIDGGEIPILFQFSGTAFYEADDGALQVSPIPWNREAEYKLPVAVWKQMMDLYYPNTAWMHLRRDVFERLLAYKTLHGIPTWEQTIERMLPS
ncbi:MAG: hypothetical protein QOJ99_5401 [Bryobacterales bacterium]|jgi:hypothetical protein|nr:hypothetical protein [Bryobacterales bacterium]